MSSVDLLTAVEDIQRAVNELELKEQQLNQQLDSCLESQAEVSRKLTLLQDVVPKVDYLIKDTVKLDGLIKHTCDLAENVSSKVRKLDLAKNRVNSAMKRVDDVLDLKNCVDGVQNALKIEDYEQAAAHINRYLSLDENLVKATTVDSAEEGSVGGAFHLLREAEEHLKGIVNEKFDTAVSSNNTVEVERFLKIFPLLGMKEKGKRKISQYLKSQISDNYKQHIEGLASTVTNDQREKMIYADMLMKLYELIAKIIEKYQPLVETYYGLGNMIPIIQAIQRECDNRASMILKAFENNRKFNLTVLSIKRSSKSVPDRVSKNPNERFDVREFDVVLNEVAAMSQRSELYFSFIRKYLQSAAELDGVESRDADISLIIRDCELSHKMQDLIGNYIALENFYMQEITTKAVGLSQSYDNITGPVTSNYVDDIFFIIKKSIRRSLSTASTDGIGAMLNNAATLLTNFFNGILSGKIKSSFIAGSSIDLTGMLQGKLQPALTETIKVKNSYLVTLNDAEVTSENVIKLCKDLEVDFRTFLDKLDDNSRHKIQSCLNDLRDTSDVFKAIVNNGSTQLCVSVIMPKIKVHIDGFTSVSHDITEETFNNYELNDPFVQNLISCISQDIQNYKEHLSTANFDLLISLLTNEITTELENAIFRSTFNRLGGLQFDKELRALVSFLTSVTQWTIRDKFARLSQIAIILNLENVNEILDYWGVNAGPLAWRLTPADVRNSLMLRVDFRREDINRIKL
ncbi:Conserved oligomeric Golgi complex subunit 4 [Trichoplax sp. H2]|nr:Conserved oligomeric Golgi complex subunit 4 [Trichoplax sp. H2]|eukprot:RDD41207.1 Conserved oligomeric Golgi complex subunit 4 [Trichoplax sp. H2]